MCYGPDLDPVELWKETTHRARKEHHCDCCGASIRPGETYAKIFTVFEGEATAEKSCMDCHESAEDFADGHSTRGVPSYMPELYRECVAESRADGDEENAAKWQGVIDAIEERRTA